MEPVCVRVYGLFSMTRRRYLVQVSIAAVLAFALLSVWFLRWPTVRPGLARIDTPIMRNIVAFWDTVPWVILTLAILQSIEAYFILRQFARKDRERREAASGPPS